MLEKDELWLEWFDILQKFISRSGISYLKVLFRGHYWDAYEHDCVALQVPHVHGNYCCPATEDAETQAPVLRKDDSGGSWWQGCWRPAWRRKRYTQRSLVNEEN